MLTITGGAGGGTMGTSCAGRPGAALAGTLASAPKAWNPFCSAVASVAPIGSGATEAPNAPAKAALPAASPAGVQAGFSPF